METLLLTIGFGETLGDGDNKTTGEGEAEGIIVTDGCTTGVGVGIETIGSLAGLKKRKNIPIPKILIKKTIVNLKIISRLQSKVAFRLPEVLTSIHRRSK